MTMLNYFANAPLDIPAAINSISWRESRSNEFISIPHSTRNVNLSPKSLTSSITATTTGELPENNTAWVVSWFDPVVPGETESFISGVLKSRGYDVSTFSPTVDALMTVKNVGVFYFRTHGGFGIKRDGTVIFSLATTTPCNSDYDNKYGGTGYFEDGLLYLSKGDNPKYCNYGISGEFISTHMSFSMNSFVYISACHSANTYIELGFQSAGASVFAGWTGLTCLDCNSLVAKKIFDWLLGTNKYEVSLGEYPYQRPFDVMAIWDNIKESGEDNCAFFPGSKFVVVKLGSDFAILAPSIKNMEVDEGTKPPATDVGTGLLTLHGIFGSDPGDQGVVTIHGEPVPIKSWEPNKIVVTLYPADHDPGGAGDVVVSVRGHKSNTVPLTRWHGVLGYTASYCPMTCSNGESNGSSNVGETYTFDLTFRADVHPYRENPGQEPIYPESVAISPAKASFAKWNLGGSCQCITSKCTTTLSETGSGEWSVYNINNTFGFSIYGMVDTKLENIQLVFDHLFIVPVGSYWESLGAKASLEYSGECSGDNNPPFIGGMCALTYSSPLVLNIDPTTFTSPGGSIDLDLGVCPNINFSQATLKWSDFTAENIPDSNTTQATLP